MTAYCPEQNWNRVWQGGKATFPASLGFQPETIKRRELGLVLISFTNQNLIKTILLIATIFILGLRQSYAIDAHTQDQVHPQGDQNVQFVLCCPFIPNADFIIFEILERWYRLLETIVVQSR